MPKKVLLIRFSSLGDVVLTSALFEPLFKRNFEIHLLTYKPYDQLFGEDKRVKTLGVSKEELKKNLKGLIKRLNTEGYFAVLDLHANPKSFLIRNLLRAGIKAVYKKRSLYRRFCVLLNRFGLAEKLKRKTFNVVEAYAQTLRVLGIEEKKPRPSVEVDENTFRETLRRFNLKGKKYIVLGVGARYRKKEYPHFGKLAEILNRRGFEVVLVGDKRDYERTKHFKGVLNLCGKLNLTESLHVLKGAALFVGNDSGTTHMARAVKTPVAVIYGGTHPCLGFSPFPDEGIVITKNLPCCPCDLHGKGGCRRNFECLDIPPEEVWEKIEAAFGGIKL